MAICDYYTLRFCWHEWFIILTSKSNLQLLKWIYYYLDYKPLMSAKSQGIVITYCHFLCCRVPRHLLQSGIIKQYFIVVTNTGYFSESNWTGSSSGWSMATESQPALPGNPCQGIVGKTTEIPSHGLRNEHSRMHYSLEQASKYTQRLVSPGRCSSEARYCMVHLIYR